MIMILLDAISWLMSQLLGFFLWLAIWPLEAVAAFFDPVLGSEVDSILDFITLVTDGFSGLTSVFADVNYFFPFYAFIAVIGAVWVFEFLLVVFHISAWSIGVDLRALLTNLVSNIVFGMVDKASDLISKVVMFFLGK